MGSSSLDQEPLSNDATTVLGDKPIVDKLRDVTAEVKEFRDSYGKEITIIGYKGEDNNHNGQEPFKSEKPNKIVCL